MSESEVAGDCKAVIPGLITLKVDCSSDISGKGNVQGFINELCKNSPGYAYQWTVIMPQLVQASYSTSSGSTNSHMGPEYCMTLPASTRGDVGWPHRVECPVSTVVAELILVSGNSVDKDTLPTLKKCVFDAIKCYLCPTGLKVWISVTSRQITDGTGDEFSSGVFN